MLNVANSSNICSSSTASKGDGCCFRLSSLTRRFSFASSSSAAMLALSFSVSGISYTCKHHMREWCEGQLSHRQEQQS